MKHFTSLLGIIIFICTSSVFSTTINGRLNVLSTTGSQLTVLLQINTNTGTDDLGGTTMVFGFDTNSINYPLFPIKGTDYIFHNFDGSHYSSATITRPRKDRIWVNIDLPFNNNNNGTIVAKTPAWTDVVTINFEVINSNIAPSFSWQLSSSFWDIYDANNFTLWNTGMFEGNFGLSVQINNGWNMVSVPGINPDGQGIDDWWSGRNTSKNVYKFIDGHFVPITVTQPGIGYWMNHEGSNIYNTGDEWPVEGIQRVPTFPVSVSQGWNLIGGFETITPINQISTTPPGLIIGPIYSYSDHYQVANWIEPGLGYMINVSAAGYINFQSGLGNEVVKDVHYFNDEWGKIILTDNLRRNFTLYLVNSDADLINYQLPPTPPEKLFDIRFGSGKIVESIASGSQSIIMKGIEYPIKISTENINIHVNDESGKIINSDLNSGEVFFISDNSINKIILSVSNSSNPNKFLLSQNYPNPFNPSTRIKFTIPAIGEEQSIPVQLKVYDILGNELMTLVDEQKEPGVYEVEINTRNGDKALASGIYIYRIVAGDFVSSKKMMLMK